MLDSIPMRYIASWNFSAKIWAKSMVGERAQYVFVKMLLWRHVPLKCLAFIAEKNTSIIEARAMFDEMFLRNERNVVFIARVFWCKFRRIDALGEVVYVLSFHDHSHRIMHLLSGCGCFLSLMCLLQFYSDLNYLCNHCTELSTWGGVLEYQVATACISAGLTILYYWSSSAQ